MEVRIKKLDSAAKLPEYAHSGDAGMDLFVFNTIEINSGERAAIPTGVAMAIPVGYVGLVWDKGGRAFKDGLKTMAGVVDAGFRGEVQVVVLNTTKKSITINTGEKIAQMLIQPVIRARLREVDELDDTARGQGKFGSTGLQ